MFALNPIENNLLNLTNCVAASQIDFGHFHKKIIANQIIVMEHCLGFSTAINNVIVVWRT